MSSQKFPAKPKFCNVLQGGYEVTTSPDVVFSTILGSCVSVCMYDPVAKLGGMNHYLLPDDGTSQPQERKYGAMAMELLINHLLRAGAHRNRLKSKVFGGAHVTPTLSNIGQRNAEFAIAFLTREGFEIEAQSTGGTNAMRVHFHAHSGAARMMRIPATQLPPTAPAPTNSGKPLSTAGEITLF